MNDPESTSELIANLRDITQASVPKLEVPSAFAYFQCLKRFVRAERMSNYTDSKT